MAVFLDTQSIYYNQVNLIAQPQSSITSRANDIPTELDKIMVAPMAAVVGQTFALKALDLGLSVCLHRFDGVEKQRKILHKIYDRFGKEDVVGDWKQTWVSVGLNDLESVKRLGHNYVLVDVANGYLDSVVQFVRELQKLGYYVMVGNVHSAKGLNLYQDCRVRVGISNGSGCDTASSTGYNRGQVTELIECVRVRDRYDSHQRIVADGGIKSGGDAAKAFGLGADEVMLGGYFALAEEAENVRNGEYRYWGGASHRQQIKTHGKIRRHSEGKDLALDKKQIRPLEELTKELWGGIASAISYSGYANLTQFRGNGVFERKTT